MPGELGDEFTGPFVGYYEDRYKPTGEWQNDSYGAVDSWEDLVPKGDTLMKMMKNKRDWERKKERNRALKEMIEEQNRR